MSRSALAPLEVEVLSDRTYWVGVRELEERVEGVQSEKEGLLCRRIERDVG